MKRESLTETVSWWLFAIGIFTLFSATLALAGPEPVSPVSPAPAQYFRSGEWDVSVLYDQVWTKTDSKKDRYLGVDHSRGGGTIDGRYFFNEYLGAGVSFSGLNVPNSTSLETGALGQRLPFAIPATGTSGFVGNVLAGLEERYPIGQFAPYGFLRAGAIFNGGNSDLKEPTGTPGKQALFHVVNNDVKMLFEPGAGIEYRLTKNLAVRLEGGFDKVDRPHSNFVSARAGFTVAF